MQLKAVRVGLISSVDSMSQLIETTKNQVCIEEFVCHFLISIFPIFLIGTHYLLFFIFVIFLVGVSCLILYPCHRLTNSKVVMS